jgi:hypothetical protein
LASLTYAYRQKTWKIVLGLLFFAGCAWIALHTARTNDRGLIINHLIELETPSATIFYWGIFAVCAAFVPLGLAGLWVGRAGGRRITLDQQAITLPKNAWSRESRTIPLAEITGLSMQTINGQTFLHMRLTSGKASLVGSMFPSKADFETFSAALAERVLPGGAASL